jgi:hypothetical protein
MKKIAIVSVFGSILVSFAVAGQFAVWEKQKSAGFNGSFEDVKNGLPENWYLYGPKIIENGDVKIELDTEDFVEGKQSLKLIAHKADPVGGNRSAGLFQVLQPVKTGKPYKVSFWLKNQGCKVRVTIKNERGHSHRGLTEAETQDRAAHPPIKKILGENETGSNTWRQFEFVYVVPETDGTLRFELNIIQAGTLWIDDVRIKEEQTSQ